MAKATIAAPNYAAYASDPVQQIYARGTLDRDMSGLSAMFLDAADRNQKRGIDSYESGVREANALSTQLAQQEMAQEKLLTILKASAGLMEKGYAPSGMQAAGQIFNDPNDNDAFSNATIGKMNADAFAARSKGAGEGKTKYTYKTQITPSGQAYSELSGSGGDPATIQDEIYKRLVADLANRGLMPNPNNPSGPPVRIPGNKGVPTANSGDADHALKKYNTPGQ